MTRAERLTRAEDRAREALDAKRHARAQVHAQQKDEQRKALSRRQLLIGKMVHEAGLLAWDNGTLRELFLLLAALAAVPDPVAVLKSLLCDSEGPALVSVDGTAEALPRVSPPC